jgi:hypothetical protein
MSTTNPQHALAHDAVPATLEHRLQELGGIPADRVSAMPTPGCATLADLIQVNERQGKLCELVDGTLVEKAMGYEASVVAAVILAFLRGYASPNRLGSSRALMAFFSCHPPFVDPMSPSSIAPWLSIVRQRVFGFSVRTIPWTVRRYCRDFGAKSRTFLPTSRRSRVRARLGWCSL